jgi:hypothetical protein
MNLDLQFLFVAPRVRRARETARISFLKENGANWGRYILSKIVRLRGKRARRVPRRGEETKTYEREKNDEAGGAESPGYHPGTVSGILEHARAEPSRAECARHVEGSRKRAGALQR